MAAAQAQGCEKLGTIAYSCPFVPPEWIAAHGFSPRRILPAIADESAAASSAGQGLCPYVQALLAAFTAPPLASALVLTTACDQMRRAAELLAERTPSPIFSLNLPATCESAAARALYSGELRRLGRFLCALGGRAPGADGLRAVISTFEERRRRLCATRGSLSARSFSEALARWHENPLGEPPPAPDGARERGAAIALVGGPLLAHLFELFDILAASGAKVVLDATTSGERTLPAPFDPEALQRDPLDALAAAYFDAIPDAFRRPNHALYTWLERKIAERGARGILFLRHTWCDTWAAETQRMRERFGLPLLELDVGCSAAVDARAITRLQAFVEILS